ncbi:MAG: FAD-binding protein [Chitinophagaceae bacterium]
MEHKWEQTYDVVVVGTGASGLTAAITAEHNGLKTLVIEKLDKWGGSTALSGGGVWIPNHYLMKEKGYLDSEEEALQYMEAIIHNVGQESSRERKKAFIKNAPKMMLLLEKLGFRWKMAEKYPDYHPLEPGGKTGRAVEGDVFDGKKLGKFLNTQTKSVGLPTIPIYTSDAAVLPLVIRKWSAFKRVLAIVAKAIGWGIRGKVPLTMGRSLTGQMMYILQNKFHTDIWLKSPLKDIIVENGKVEGVLVEKDGKEVYVKTNKGLLLGAGGFERNDEYRRKHQFVGADYTLGSVGNTGDATQLGEKLGAELALMDEAWWGGGYFIDGVPFFSVFDRSMPGSMIVDQLGHRFVNESTSYVVLGRTILDHHLKTGSAIPAWYILDGNHRRRYLLGMIPPGITPKKLIKSGQIIKADSIEDLAKQCDINVENLKETVKKFNSYAYQGKDPDFKRGDDIYDRYYSESSVEPNSNLAPIQNPPFYALKFYPVDLGTKGGLLTDEFGRVLRKDATPIEGLYASGNNTASVMGRIYPGPGATLGAACTFSYIAMNHLASVNN